MNSNPIPPNSEDSTNDSPANSSAQQPVPEIRYDTPIRVPEHLIPPAEPVPPAIDPLFPPVDQQEVARAGLQNVPPDFRVPWNWSDLILFAIFYFGSAVMMGLILLIGAAAITHRGLQDLAADKSLSAIVGIVAQAMSSALALLYLWVLVRKRSGGPFWNAIGWRPLQQDPANRVRPWPFVAAGVGLAIVAIAADELFPSKGTLPMEEMFQTRSALILLSLFGILVAPFIEEIIFRGFLYPVVGRAFGAAAAVVITGMIFGAYHAPQLWGGWAQIGLIMVVGIVLTWARARQKSVLASFLIHITYNSTIFLVLMVTTSGFRHMQP